MADFHFVTNSTHFQCSRCTRCCSLDVMLSDEEMARLGDNADSKWRTTKKVMGSSNLTCSLLQGKTCTIYETRPKLCRVYPFFAVNMADLVRFGIKVPDAAICLVGEDGEKYFIIYDEECPGVGKGGASNWPEIVALTISHFRDFNQSK